MTAKLHINISEGTLSVEGGEEFVRSIYSDFRDKLIQEASRRRIPAPEIEISPESNSGPSKKPAVKSPRSSNTKKTASGGYKPEVDPNLDLSKLADFYGRFNPKNHSEKILIFAAFLRDTLKKAPCTANDIYSCYFELRDQTEIPEAFHQAFITAWNRTKWVKFVSKDEITITTAGENHFIKMSKGKPSE